MTSKKRTKKRAKPDQKSFPEQSTFQADAGELWIEPNLNRKISGPGGNRGDHTTSAVELLKLADIALKKDV